MKRDPRITCFGGCVWQLEQPLSPEIPLHVHLIVGDTTVLIDTGLSSTYPLIGQLLATAGVSAEAVRIIFNTHGHHDHIGSNRRLKEDTHALVAAAAGAARWIESYPTQLREFAFHHPEIIPDSPEMRTEIEESMDGEVRVDVLLEEGTRFQLGRGVELEVLSVPGHVPAELAYYERSSGSLIIGDAVTGIDWSFFHGHVQPSTYRATLARLRQFAATNRINRALLAHYPLLDGMEFVDLLSRAEAYVDTVDNTIVGILRDAGGSLDLETIWRGVCQIMNKQLEFRGLGMVDGHVRELTARGKLARVGADRYAWIGA